MSTPVKYVYNYTNPDGLEKEIEINFSVLVRKLTDFDLMIEAFKMTSHKEIKKISLSAAYKSEHSPIRTQMFWIEMYGIPHFVSTHFPRHSVGNSFYVRTGREDRGQKGEQDRWTPSDMAMLVNAQSLINMSRKRLCAKSHAVTQRVFREIKKNVAKVDPDLAKYMVRECIYRNGFCPEFKSCGFIENRGK